MAVQPVFRQAPQLDEGAVVESELLVPAEDRHRGRQLVQRVGMGVDMLLQPRFRRRHVGHVDRGADDAGIAQREFR